MNTSVRTGADLIAAERQRQIDAEGWSIEHDREHGATLLCRAGHAYATGNSGWWPFDNGASFKPKGPLRNLVRAGALYQAAADVSAGGEQSLERWEGYRDDCARRIDVLIAEVLAVFHGTHDSSLDGVRRVVLAEFWAALAVDSRRAADGWFWHEDELNDVLRSFGLLDRNEVFRGQ